MTHIAISGASGDLGRRITRLLLDRIPASKLSLVTRTPRNLADRERQGASVHYGNYRDPASLAKAYAGSDVLMLISGLDVTHRIPEHRNAINAAREAGIRHIVYTSVAGIHPRNPTLSASDHIVTEQDLRSSGLGFTALRNATYAEILATVATQPPLRSGIWRQVSGTGRMAPVSKQDIARCAAACLLNPEFHDGAVYEISGPELFSFEQIAALASDVYQTPIAYQEVTLEERFAEWDAMGVPRRYSESMDAHPDAHLWTSEELVSAEIAIQAGYHAILTDHVTFITGSAPATLRDVFMQCKGVDYGAA